MIPQAIFYFSAIEAIVGMWLFIAGFGPLESRFANPLSLLLGIAMWFFGAIGVLAVGPAAGF